MGAEPRWRLDPEPLVDIGGSADHTTQQFLDIRSVTRLSDGRIVVADGATAEMRFFDEEGEH